MHNSAPFHPQPSGLSLVELDPGAGPVQVVGVSAAWRKLLVQADMVAPHVQVATIEGEHGTGKHTLARYLFSRSPLSTSNFQRRDAREWLATDADASTLVGFTYLDRVDLLAPPGQGLLLGVLKNLQDRPPGRAVLIASSQTPLRHMAGQGLLLPDLAFRLTSIRFSIPPLRQRREDIAPLVQFLLDRICARYQQRPVLLGPGALARLLQHSWPGNVREMAAILENALLQAENGVIRASDLALPEGLQQIPNSQFDPQHTSNSAFNSLSTTPANPQLNPQVSPWSNLSTSNGQMLDPQSSAGAADLALDTIINHHVQFVLDFNRGNKLRTARQLGISRSTLYRILANESFLAR
jgi:DNA-binding NtrC family response regulator